MPTNEPRVETGSAFIPTPFQDSARTDQQLTERLNIQGPLLSAVAMAEGAYVDTRTEVQNDDADPAVLDIWLTEHGVQFSAFVDVLLDQNHALYPAFKEKHQMFLSKELSLETFTAWLHRIEVTSTGHIELAGTH